MFDIGWTELLVIGVVALLVIGPRDLPDMFRTLGRFTAKARSMARDFQRAMESAADEAGVKDVAKDLKTMTSARSMGLDAVKNAATKFEKWDPLKPAAKPAPAAAPVAEKPAAPMGPATQALAEAQAAKRAAQAAPAILKPESGSPAPAAPPRGKPGAAKAAAPDVPVAAADPPPAARPARRAKKPDAGKTDA